MCSCNCCFLICIQISQEAGKVVWYSHLLKNFPQFVVIYTVKSFSFSFLVNEEVNVFLELSCFFNDPADVGNLISDSSAFSKTSLNKTFLSFHVPKRTRNIDSCPEIGNNISRITASPTFRPVVGQFGKT